MKILQLLKLLKQLLVLTKQNFIYQTALNGIGIDVSPEDLASDELGCAESVTNILNKTVGTPIILGTWTLNEHLKNSPEWELVTNPIAGDVVISPTGAGGRGKIGHTGIVGLNNIIMSNNSWTGKWSTHYTIDTWRAKYSTFPVYYYRLK